MGGDKNLDLGGVGRYSKIPKEMDKNNIAWEELKMQMNDTCVSKGKMEE